MSDAAVWADCAKGYRYCHREPTKEEKTYAQNNKEHHDYHYTDVPIQQASYRAGTAGTMDADVVHILREAILTLKGQTPAEAVSDLDQKTALWLLVHQVGDIHQPLHVGAIYFNKDCSARVDPNVVGAGKKNFGIGKTVRATQGGNKLMLGEEAELHAFWDSGAVDRAITLSHENDATIPQIGAYFAAHPIANWQTTGAVDTWPMAWANETFVLAKGALGTNISYGDGEVDDAGECVVDVMVTPKYRTDAGEIAVKQLTRAGFRLAAVLEAIFP